MQCLDTGTVFTRLELTLQPPVRCLPDDRMLNAHTLAGSRHHADLRQEPHERAIGKPHGIVYRHDSQADGEYFWSCHRSRVPATVERTPKHTRGVAGIENFSCLVERALPHSGTGSFTQAASKYQHSIFLTSRPPTGPPLYPSS